MKRSSSLAAAIAAGLLLSACGASGPSASASEASSGAAKQGAVGGLYVQHDLVSDVPGAAEHTDANLVNAWGIARLPTSPWWVADNGTGVSTLYDGDGAPRSLVVSVTGAGGGAAAPTGLVANADATAFLVSSGGASGPARFIFASEDGTISGWNPNVPTAGSTVTIVAVDRSTDGAIYKGLALAGDRLYATDFHNRRVDVFDAAFAPVSLPAGAFVDAGIPDTFGPFGIQAVEGMILVTYAMQDPDKEDDVAGKHLGFVSAFTPDGTFVRRVASAGKLNAPWGMAMAPETGFGRASGKLLVGNFGDGHLIAYDLEHENESEGGEAGGGAYLTGAGGPIVIDGLWGIGFGNGGAAGHVNELFFAAGPDDESHGLFGRIDFVPGPGQQD
jgi:uncharacterized protein (TIGR03118 family)